MLSSYLLPCRKGLVNLCRVSMLTLAFSSCMKNTYFNSRAIAPVFKDSTYIHVEAYLGQGVRQVGANISYAPISQGFVTGNYNLGAGHSWEAGLGGIPFKVKNHSLYLLGTYGRGHVNYSFKKDIPFEYTPETKKIDATYQKLSGTVYSNFEPTSGFLISAGFRYNFVQYFKYYENRNYMNSPPKELLTQIEGKDSLSFDVDKHFHTLDPFLKGDILINKYFSVSCQVLYSFSNRFTMNGKGYKIKDQNSREDYTYVANLPQYKRLVVNLALVAHIGSFKNRH